ncbi:PqiC family protein [Methylovorus mays]|uniref:PqiC family protein n=1 Tax=Methylovorus mays TaxID=184077 RepID=UPI001E441D6C|nr:PqiC family protein [Methylovorus mays]MCB5207004.1 PqiC family protein [Methylovorus mays]
MIRINRIYLGGLLMLAMSGCSSVSAPVHYHTLLAPAASIAESQQKAAFLIEVLPVGIPPQLDQSQLVVRQGGSNVAIVDGERWAGPLADEFRNALSAQLTQRLHTQDIAGLPAPRDQPVLRIKVQVRRLDAWLGQNVQLDADWSLGFVKQTGNARFICRGQFQEQAPGGYAELVQAQQRSIAALAVRVAEQAHAWANTQSATCS